MPFGLCNATATFQRLMAHALIGVTKKYGNLEMCYVDDVVIATARSHRATGRGVCMHEQVGAKVQTIKVRDTQGFDKILEQDGGQARHQTGSRCSRSSSIWEIAKNGTPVDELTGFCELLQGIHQGLCRQGIPDAQINETQMQKIHMEQRSRRIIPEKKERVVRGTVFSDANGKRDVRVGYGRVGSRDFWNSPSRTRMEREDSLKTNSEREKSLE